MYEQIQQQKVENTHVSVMVCFAVAPTVGIKNVFKAAL